jgi:hypothetical protein
MIRSGKQTFYIDYSNPNNLKIHRLDTDYLDKINVINFSGIKYRTEYRTEYTIYNDGKIIANYNNKQTELKFRTKYFTQTGLFWVDDLSFLS